MTSRGAPSLQHPPSTAEKYPPPPGAWCSNFWGTRRWTERYEPKGWRCATCHPPLHLRADQVWINDQPRRCRRSRPGRCCKFDAASYGGV
jgi:hypothetical protein